MYYIIIDLKCHDSSANAFMLHFSIVHSTIGRGGCSEGYIYHFQWHFTLIQSSMLLVNTSVSIVNINIIAEYM